MNEQIETYEGKGEIKSDPWGLLTRDNRNHQKKQSIILDTVNADRGDTVLEVGCGHGLHAQRYDNHFIYYGVDISSSLVDETQSKISTGTTRQCDAMDLPYESNTFDAVVGTAILHHMNDYEQALTEWQRVVNRGGSVTLMEPNPLFPKDFASLFLQEKERHKWGMFPWRIRETLEETADFYRLEPRIYTPPIPESLIGVYDRIDDAVQRVPGARWGSQMLLIHVEV